MIQKRNAARCPKRFHYDRPLASIENIVPFVVDLVAARGLCPRAFGVGLWKPFHASLLNVSPYPAVAVCARDSTGNKIKILLVLLGVQALFGPRVGEWAVRIVCSNFIDMLFLTWGGFFDRQTAAAVESFIKGRRKIKKNLRFSVAKGRFKKQSKRYTTFSLCCTWKGVRKKGSSGNWTLK